MQLVALYRKFAWRAWLIAASILSIPLLSLPLQAANVDIGITSREIIMSGLNAPRGITIGPDGGIYVAEAGSSFDTTDAQHIQVRGVDFYYGETGSVSRFLGGVQSTLFSALPTLYAPSNLEAMGPSHLVFSSNGDAYITIGMGLDVVDRTGSFTKLGNVVRIPFGSTSALLFADIAQYELDHNPAGDDVHSNPFRIAAAGGDGFYVMDAGANALLNVSSSGVISTHTIFPVADNGQQSVPTALAVSGDGKIYVGELTGFPFTHGDARIFSIEGEDIFTIGTGFTHIIDLALASDGTLFVLEHNSDSLFNPEGFGSLYAFDPGTGARTLLADDLVAPTGLAIDVSNILYVSNYGHGDGQGQVLAFTYAAIPEPQTWAMLCLSALIVWRFRGRRQLA